jgi:hypothetical protein
MGCTEAPPPSAARGQQQRPLVGAPLLAAALATFDRTQNVRWAVPVFAAIDPGRVTTLLPLAAALCGQPGGMRLRSPYYTDLYVIS